MWLHYSLWHTHGVGQVPRILNPVVLVLDALPGLCADVNLAAYIKSMWGGVEECRCGRAAMYGHVLAADHCPRIMMAADRILCQHVACITPQCRACSMYIF